MSKIRVEIREDSPGRQWWHVVIKLPGYGERHRGFGLVNVGDEEREIALFRPEYAKAIKEALDGAVVHI